jgi:hypothetical protein
MSSFHPRLGLASGLLLSGFPTEILYEFLNFPSVLHVHPVPSGYVCKVQGAIYLPE